LQGGCGGGIPGASMLVCNCAVDRFQKAAVRWVRWVRWACGGCADID
jgi:hypothetical protein